MGSLEQEQHNGCRNGNTNKPKDEIPEVLRHSPSSQPLYELQLVAWPNDMNEDANSAPAPATITTTTTAATTTTMTPTVLPLYEDQLVVFPQMDFQEENFDYIFDDLEAAANSSTTQPDTTLRPTPTPTPTPTP
ncbi:uncharacterized protein LOC108605115, partial [Drosophila busckii]|uniref:uncharacterized protein LOC108605115 n=1 Tax=Drosophila busckii TaxID=30019 RepID=UPI001432950B